MAKSYNVLDVENNEELIYRLKNDEEKATLPTGMTYSGGTLTIDAKYKNTSGLDIDVASVKASYVDSDEDDITSIEAINASASSLALNIAGSSETTAISGSKGANKISGSALTNVTLGAGADTFVYSGGAVTVADYAASQKDVIQFSSATKVATAITADATNKNITIDFGSGDSLVLNNASGQNVSIVDKDGNKVSALSRMYGPTVTITDSVAASYDFTNDDVVKTINAGSAKGAINITADTDVTITAGTAG